MVIHHENRSAFHTRRKQVSGVRVQRAIVPAPVPGGEGERKVVDVRDGQVQPLRSGRRHDARGVTREEQAPVAHRLRHEASERRDALPDRRAGDERAGEVLGQPMPQLAPEPLVSVEFEALIADKAYDSNELRAQLQACGAMVVIPPRANRVEVIEYDSEMYKWRHLVENFFCKLKNFRRVAMRFEKTDVSYAAMIHAVSSRLALV